MSLTSGANVVSISFRVFVDSQEFAGVNSSKRARGWGLFVLIDCLVVAYELLDLLLIFLSQHPPPVRLSEVDYFLDVICLQNLVTFSTFFDSGGIESDYLEYVEEAHQVRHVQRRVQVPVVVVPFFHGILQIAGEGWHLVHFLNRDALSWRLLRSVFSNFCDVSRFTLDLLFNSIDLGLPRFKDFGANGCHKGVLTLIEIAVGGGDELPEVFALDHVVHAVGLDLLDVVDVLHH